MSQGLIEFLKARKIWNDTGKWPGPRNWPAFSEAELKAILEKIAALKDAPDG